MSISSSLLDAEDDERPVAKFLLHLQRRSYAPYGEGPDRCVRSGNLVVSVSGAALADGGARGQSGRQWR